jgi:hypothetical protein
VMLIMQKGCYTTIAELLMTLTIKIIPACPPVVCLLLHGVLNT